MIRDVVEEYGHLDILVNNAGITRDGLIMKMKEEDFDAVLNINLKGTFNTIRHSARQMLKQRSGKDHQHFLCVRNPGKSRTGQLCSIQGRRDRSHEDYGQRAGKPRNYCKCHCTGFRGYRDDRSAFWETA